MSEKEKEVFAQDVAPEELNAVAGGAAIMGCGKTARETPECTQTVSHWDDNPNECISDHYRAIDGGNGFPNCAATVEDSERYSSCMSVDACWSSAVLYQGMTICHNAWK